MYNCYYQRATPVCSFLEAVMASKAAKRAHTIKAMCTWISTGVKLFIASKVQSLISYETSTTEGGEGEVGGHANFRNKAHRTFDPRNNSTLVGN